MKGRRTESPGGKVFVRHAGGGPAIANRFDPDVLRLKSNEARLLMNLILRSARRAGQVRLGTEGPGLNGPARGESMVQSRAQRSVVWAGKLIALVTLLIAVLTSYWLASVGKQARTPTLVVEESNLSVGEVWEDPEFEWKLPIRNTTDRQIEITGFAASCACATIKPPSLTIPPRGTMDVSLTLNLLGICTEPDIVGKDFTISIQPRIAEAGARIVWVVKGKVKQSVTIQPKLVDFGRCSERKQPMPTQRVRITTHPSVRILNASCTSPRIEVKVQPLVPEHNDVFHLIVTPHGELPRGVVNCSIAVVPTLDNGRRLPAKQINVHGHIVNDIEASPPSIIFGAGTLGTSLRETVLLRSLTGRSFTITGIRHEGEGLSVKRVPAEVTIGSAFAISQIIGKEGDQVGQVVFRLSHTEGPEEEVVVPISWYGIKGH